jgi:uroporphyrin-III C-methyltransferase
MSATDTSDQSQPASSNASAEPSASENKPQVSDGKTSAPKAKSATTNSTSSKASWLLCIALLLLTGVVTAAGYWGWQQLSQQQASVIALQQETEIMGRTRDVLQAQLTTAQEKLDKQLDQQQQQSSGVERALAATEQRLNSQGKRLRNLTSTSREDWLLAEAEYLLRLANQRLLMERETEGAVALLDAADHILRDIDDMNLFAVREALAKDMAALKLAPSVDRAGLYLELAALAQQIETLDFVQPTNPVLITKAQEKPEVVFSSSSDSAVSQTVLSWQDLVMQSFQAAMGKLQQHISIQQHEKLPPPLLAPEHQAYLKQNLRLMLEQAQLALMREEQKVYQHSLQQASTWLHNYFTLNPQAILIAEEVDGIARQQVKQQLPNISASLESLRGFMGDLHKLTPRDQQNPTVLESSANADNQAGENKNSAAEETK